MKKFVIDGTIKIVDENENAIEGMTVGKLLHEMLWKNSSHDTLKCYDFGLEMKRNQKLVLDESDFRFIEDVVQKSITAAMFKAPVTRALNKAKDEANKEPAKE